MQCKSEGSMEDMVTEKVCSTSPIASENEDVRNIESAENFQKFMYELFEKNGVMNDLRAYLRGHIIGILRSVRTGDPPPCQKHFTQRLELPYQALNMLLAEYMLRLEFSYTLSVFISEIPLANMVLDFAKCLMQGDQTNAALRFKDEDVWSILSYLGIKCDSEHASNIVEMYKKETQSPLLLCMLKCVPMYAPIGVDKVSSQDSISTVRSSDAAEKCPPHSAARCHHLAFCQACHGNMLRVKDKYAKKKNTLAKNVKESSLKPQNVESIMKNIDVVERKLIDEMFQQLKCVYEEELRMVKAEEEERVKRSLASHAALLKTKRIEMEEGFKARELELARKVQQKKRFLWGLAQMLRDQHQQMSKAMRDVQTETSRLSAKEDSLKSQLVEAETILRSRGEEMRRQISSELITLEEHLDSMRRERDTINKERSELEHLKFQYDSNSKGTNVDTAKEDIRSHYELLKNEFDILKKYLESAKLEPKCVIERATSTEDGWTKTDGVLNNGQDLDRNREDRVKAKQVVNDLKKMKNVNFMQSYLTQTYRERSRSSPNSIASSETMRRDPCDIHDEIRRSSCDATRRNSCDETRRKSVDVSRRTSCDDLRRSSSHDLRHNSSDDLRRDSCQTVRQESCEIRRLMEENERLRAFATQQREHIDELSSHQARLQAELTAARLTTARPRTAPANMPNSLSHRMSSPSWSQGGGGQQGAAGQGAGEQMSFFSNVQPRILLPGDTLPFIGVVRDRHNDNRRYLINQWRSLRRRASPGAGGRAARDLAERADSAGPSAREPSEEDLNNDDNQEVTMDHPQTTTREQYEQRPTTFDKDMKRSETNSKSRVREAKEKLKQSFSKEERPSGREPSPHTVIRDAKRRLRKLEIEAEAVEKSYLDFRRKRDATWAGEDATRPGRDAGRDLDSKQNQSSLKEDASRLESTSRYVASHDPTTKQIIDNYIKHDIGATYFKNKNATPMKVRPIPESTAYVTKTNYLDTSLTEFRKFYHSEGNRKTDERPSTPIPKHRDLETLKPVTLRLETNFENPRTPSPKLETEDRSSTPNAKNRSLDNSESNKTLSHEESITSNKNNDNPLSNRDHKQSQNSKTNRPKSPTNKSTKGTRLEVHQQAKNDKSKELEILKQNVGKIYNLPEKTITESNNYRNTIQNAEREMEHAGKVSEDITEAPQDENDVKSKDRNDQNLLRIEVQSITRADDVQIRGSQQDLLLVVESSSVEHSQVDFQENVPAQMTILISPKKNSPKEPQDSKLQTNNDGEKSAEVTSLYQVDANDNISSIQMQLESSKDLLVPFLSDLETNDEEDNFLQNSNSLKYDTEPNHSPISMGRTSEDENFWDS